MPRRHVHVGRRASRRGARRQPPRGRRGQGAGRALHRAGRRRPAAIFAAGQRGLKGHRGGAGAGRRRHRRDAGICASRRNMPLAIEPLHPAYAADRACVNTTKQALDICDRLDPQRTRRARRRARRLSHLVGSGTDAADRARRQGSPARVSRLRLAGADQGHPQRPRHDGRRRHRHQIGARGRRGAGLCRLFRDRDLLQRLVEEADG